MKKAIAFVTALTLLFVSLTACNDAIKPGVIGGNTNEAETNTDGTPITEPGEMESNADETKPIDPEHTHVWSEWSTVQEATCSTSGMKERVCACGEKEQESITVLDHTYGDKECINCGAPKPSEGLEFTTFLYEDGTCGVDGIGSCTDTEIIIPAKSSDGDVVVSIEWRAFEDCTNLRSVTIPSSVVSIGPDAFRGCDKVIEVENGISYVDNWAISCDESVSATKLRADTRGIADAAFSECEFLRSITIPDSVISIDNDAFAGCTKLETITFGAESKLLRIGGEAFVGCDSLTSITIPASATYIPSGAFARHIKINVDNNNQTYSSIDGVLYNKAFTKLLSFPNVNEFVNIPTTVTSIGDFAFRDCFLLTDITIPNSVTSIGEAAFSGCTGLTNLVIPDSVTSIGSRVFQKCSNLTSITIPFPYGGMLDTTVPSSLETVVITGGTSIDDMVFSGWSSVTSIAIPDSVTSIGESAFYGCTGLTSIAIPTSVTSIGAYAFAGCSGLTSIAIPDSVTSIGAYAFSGCSSLTSITIPDSMTSIDYAAFRNCSSLMSITFDGTIAQWNAIEFSGNWRHNIPATKVICSDGEVILN